MAQWNLAMDDEVADFINNRFGATELRTLASNLNVSRERGDSKRRTAERIVAQDPQVAAKIVEAYPEGEIDATRFRERREVGREKISLLEAKERARNKSMLYKLKALERATLELTQYDVEINWEYSGNAGITSIIISAEDVNPLLDGRAHIILTARGSPKLLETRSKEYKINTGKKTSRQWKLFLSAVERFWE